MVLVALVVVFESSFSPSSGGPGSKGGGAEVEMVNAKGGGGDGPTVRGSNLWLPAKSESVTTDLVNVARKAAEEPHHQRQ